MRSVAASSALVFFVLLSTGSSHDQYFFKRPNLMVAGAVTPPRLDLSNEDLVRAHVYAIWLAESRLHLGRTLKDVLDLAGDDPSLEVLASVEDALNSESARLKAKARAKAVLTECRDELVFADGDVFDQAGSMQQRSARLGLTSRKRAAGGKISTSRGPYPSANAKQDHS